jgi:hypothetical protein
MMLMVLLLAPVVIIDLRRTPARAHHPSRRS